MADQASMSITFLTFIVLFMGVGLYSSTRQQNNTTDYLLAGRGVNPWLTALSTVATGNSGFMFIGLIGFTYQVGLSAIWLTIGYILGDGLAWLTVHRRLRQVSEESNVETIPAFLGQGVLGGRWITIASAVITLLFLGTYAAAQLHAGSKALSVLFGWESWVGVVFGAVVVGIYCVSGGIRASIWVGSIQAILMLLSMMVLSGVAIAATGGLSGLWQQLNTIDPTLTRMMPSSLRFGFWPFAIAWTVSGFGVVGQPHIMIRAMAIESTEQVSEARNIYVVFNAVFAIAATVVGLTARVLLPDLLGMDTELALPQLASTLLPGIMVGFILVGLFSATISTADAQVLSCSAALTQDLFPQATAPTSSTTSSTPSSTQWAKLGTLTVLGLILIIALNVTDNVFTLVMFSWAALASSLGPLLVVQALKRPLNWAIAIGMILTGIVTAIIWRLGLQLSQDIYEVLPGMVASTMVYLICQPFISDRSAVSDVSDISDVSNVDVKADHVN